MMRGSVMSGASLLGSLLFAVVAGLGFVPWMRVVAPAAGGAAALSLYVLGAAVAYAVTVSPTWSRAVVMGGLATVLACPVAVFAPRPTGAVFGAALIVSIVRSGFLHRSRPARSLVLELLLAGGGLVFAGWLAGDTVLGLALGVWGFFLVQSLFFLAGGVRERSVEDDGLDPFERSRQRALALMDG